MDSVPPETPRGSSPSGPFFMCPTCASWAMDVVQRDESGIRVVDCLCAHGHVWTVRWLEVA